MKCSLCAAILALASCANAQAPPTDWSAVRGKERNIAWIEKLGNYTLSHPVVADGRVWVGTDNDPWAVSPAKEQAGVLLCFRERDGMLLWRRDSAIRKELNREAQGFITTLRGSPCVEGDRLWLLDNRWEVVCFDIGPLRRGTGEPRLLWKTDLIETTGTKPEIPGMGFSLLRRVASTSRIPIRRFSFTTSGPARTGPWQCGGSLLRFTPRLSTPTGPC